MLSGAKFQSVKCFKFGAMDRDNKFKFGAQKLQVFQRSSISFFDRLNTPLVGNYNSFVGIVCVYVLYILCSP